jgi:hypothetical protein
LCSFGSAFEFSGNTSAVPDRRSRVRDEERIKALLTRTTSIKATELEISRFELLFVLESNCFPINSGLKTIQWTRSGSLEQLASQRGSMIVDYVVEEGKFLSQVAMSLHQYLFQTLDILSNGTSAVRLMEPKGI